PFGNGPVSRYPGAFPPVLESFCPTFSPGPTDRPWVSEDALGSALPATTIQSIFSASGVPGCYTSHTFRSSTATSAASCGLPDHLIKTLGRLSSDAYQIYINTPVSTIVGVASLLT
ncbi:unnamed protein product, partial [Porites lobata]